MVGEVAVAVEAALPQRPGTGQREVSCTLEVLGERRAESVSKQLQSVVDPGALGASATTALPSPR